MNEFTKEEKEWMSRFPFSPTEDIDNRLFVLHKLLEQNKQNS